MVTPTFDISEYGLRSTTPRAPQAPDEGLRYRFDVLAGSAVDVIQSAGGFLYDRAMAGWEVTVQLPRRTHGRNFEDSRPLRILGVRVSDLQSDLTSEYDGPMPHSLAVSADVYSADARVRERLVEARGHRLTEVALWGEGWPLAMNRGMTSVQYVLSAAARVFKRQALAAAGIPCETVDPTETLLSDMATWAN
ncbi:MAG: hypothetical protein ACLPXZ_21805 [Mycobacterium sp.]